MADNQTKKDIELALLRIQKGRPRVVDKKRKLSIIAVAEEAKVSPALIHNHYPEIAARINALTNRSVREQRDRKNDELKKAREHNKELARENDELKEKLRQAGIEILVLQEQVDRLQGASKGKNIYQFKPKQP